MLKTRRSPGCTIAPRDLYSTGKKTATFRYWYCGVVSSPLISYLSYSATEIVPAVYTIVVATGTVL